MRHADLGTMLNHAMFQRNGRCGYVLKPPALRENGKDLLLKHSKHFLDISIISAQQLPRRNRLKDEVVGTMIDPVVEVSLHVPDWTSAPFLPATQETAGAKYVPSSGQAGAAPGPSTGRSIMFRTAAVKNNGFNPVWEEHCSLPFDCVGDMTELAFVKFTVKDDGDSDDSEPIAVYCTSLKNLREGEPPFISISQPLEADRALS
jgi:phosphatidylinositol phospholipase C delta